MQIMVNIPDEFAARVQARGLTPQGYVEHLIAEQISAGADFAPSRNVSLAELDASLDELTRYSEKTPSLPDEALSRESLYQDHD